MKVPLTDLRAQYLNIRGEIDSAIQNVIDTSQFVLGGAVSAFEEAFAAAHGVRHCIGVGSGTDALHLALWAQGVGPGDGVVTTPFTFIATAEMISLVGAKPIFVDIDPRTMTMDVNRLADAVARGSQSRKGGIRAVIPVHLYGCPADMDGILRLAEEYRVSVIEDACQAHLARFNGRPVGSFGSAACFSFYPAKNLGAYGEAGAVTTQDDTLAARIRQLRDHGQSAKYVHETRGHNYRMDGIQGAVLGVKMKYLSGWTKRRREIARLYRSRLDGVDGITLPFESPQLEPVYHQFVIRTKERAGLEKELRSKGISTALHYPIPLHLQQAYADLGYKKGDYPVSEMAAEQCISLPLYPEMTGEQVDYVVSSVRHFFR